MELTQEQTRKMNAIAARCSGLSEDECIDIVLHDRPSHTYSSLLWMFVRHQLTDYDYRLALGEQKAGVRRRVQRRVETLFELLQDGLQSRHVCFCGTCAWLSGEWLVEGRPCTTDMCPRCGLDLLPGGELGLTGLHACAMLGETEGARWERSFGGRSWCTP